MKNEKGGISGIKVEEEKKDGKKNEVVHEGWKIQESGNADGGVTKLGENQ